MEFTDTVVFNSEEEYNSFIAKLEGYNFYKCGFDSPSEYPAVLHYSDEPCPESRDRIYKGEYKYPERDIKYKVDFLMSFLYHLDRESIFIHEDTTRPSAEYMEYSPVDDNKLRRIAEDWLRSQK